MSISNVLLIDQSITDYEVFVTSVNAATIPIVYSRATTRNELLTQLSAYTSIDRIGIAFSNNGTDLFLEGQTFFGNTLSNFNANMNFIIQVIQQFNVKNIDYLACNTLNTPGWNEYYASLLEQTGVIVGASNDQTGNIQYGGDWVLESTGQDIEDIYFTQSIEYYKYLLDSRSNFNFIIKQDNTLWGVGYNIYGTLGLGTNTSISSYQQVTLPDGKIPLYIETGALHTIILTTDLSLYSTGGNGSGQLCIGSRDDKYTFQKITLPVGKTPSTISCGKYHTAVLMTDGTLYGAGINADGQFGTGDYTPEYTSLRLITNPDNKIPKKVVCGHYHTMLLMTDNTVYGTGGGIFGQLGLGNYSVINIFTRLTMPGSFVPLSISCGQYFTLILMNDASGTIYGTGINGSGQLGIDNLTNQNTLQPLLNSTGKIPSSISSGTAHAIITMSDGTLYGVGANNTGQLGFGNYTSPIKVIQSVTTLPAGKTVTTLMCGINTITVLFSDGTLYGTGGNTYGELGLGNTTSFNSMQLITGVSNVKKITGSDISITSNTISSSIVCFKEGSLILTDKGYLPIQQLRPGDLVKTLLNGFVPICMIGKRDIYHPASVHRVKDQLYVCTSDAYPEVFEPLVITGCHSILVYEYASNEEREHMLEVNGDTYMTDDYYRLPACVDKRAKVYDKQGTYTIYHIALEHHNYYMNYGVYANGLLVETCSKRYLKELSNMELISPVCV